MKKPLLFSTIIIITALATINSWGAKYQQNNFTPVQFSPWVGIPNWPEARYVDGIRLGTPWAHSTYGTLETLNGVEIALISQSKNVNGLQVSFINLLTENINGVQLGFFSMGYHLNAFQLGCYNFSAMSRGVQLGVGNLGGHDSHTIQMGVANFQGENSSGAQIGISSYCDSYEGFQMGMLFNISSDASSDVFQIGLFNYCDNGFLPFFPFFNFSSFEGRESRYPRALDYMTSVQIKE